MTDMTADKLRLEDILKSGQPLPPDEVMIEKALEILNFSPHGQQLVDFVQKEKIVIKIIATPMPSTYLPESRLVYIGFNRNKPVSPSRFVLMMTGILREAQQELSGIKHPPVNAPMQEHLKVSMAKHEDKVWYMCTISTELNALEIFSEYNFLDELRKMGHDESLALYLKQERKG